jgi:RAB6A-GEF complex partner protein 2
MAESMLLEEAVRVAIEPSQASYFAGEVFAVTITVTNTRQPESAIRGKPSSQSAAGYGHKRGAHSVSYMPMARPPTSPGVRTALPAVASYPDSGSTSVARCGLVGKTRHSSGTASPDQQVHSGQRRVVSTKSLSVSFGAQDLQLNGLEDQDGKPPMNTLRAAESHLPGE